MSLKQIALAADQFLNACLGGYADETLSSRCWRLQERAPYNYARAIIDFLFFWQVGHCFASYMAELERRHSPRDFQNLP